MYYLHGLKAHRDDAKEKLKRVARISDRVAVIVEVVDDPESLSILTEARSTTRSGADFVLTTYF